jgi:hypothetical protein
MAGKKREDELKLTSDQQELFQEELDLWNVPHALVYEESMVLSCTILFFCF